LAKVFDLPFRKYSILPMWFLTTYSQLAIVSDQYLVLSQNLKITKALQAD